MATENKKSRRRGNVVANRFIGDYDTVRPLLRYISYGCYHKSFLVERLGQSTRAYEENMARLRFFLPEGSLQSSRHGRRELYRFEGDSYRVADDFLAYTYRIKALKRTTAFCLIGLFQILGAAKEPLDVTTIFERELFAGGTISESMEDLSRRTVQRYLQDLEEQGVISSVVEKGRLLYWLAADPLANLSAEEAAALCRAAAFYRAVIPLALPGCFLEDTLRRKIMQETGENEERLLVQFKHRAAASLLDDEVLHQCLMALEERRELMFSYVRPQGSTKLRVVPRHLVSDVYSGRRYVLAERLPAKKGRRPLASQMFRLDLMQKVRLGEVWEGVVPIRSPKARELLLVFSPRREADGALVEGRIRARFPEARIEEAAGRLQVRIEIEDARSLLPWLRTFWPLAHLSLPEAPSLAARMKKDWEEALENYGEHPALS